MPFCLTASLLYTDLSNLSRENSELSKKRGNLMEFKQRLKKIISESGQKQKDLAEYVGVKQSTVSDWINKGTSPKIENIYKIVEFFNITFEYLFTGEQPPIKQEMSSSSGSAMVAYGTATIHNSPKVSEMEEELIEEFQKLNFKDKRKIFDYIDTLKENESN